MNAQEIKMRAERGLTSNFDGKYEGQQFAGMFVNHPGLKFTGSDSSFVNQPEESLQYSITVENTGTAAVDRVIALHPGYLTVLADITDAGGTAAAAIVTDGTIISTTDAEVVCTGEPKKIAHLQAFANRNPMRFTGLKMLVNNSDQFEQVITVRKLSPLQDLGYSTIRPSVYKDSKQTDDKRVEVPLNDFQLDDQTAIITKIKAGRTATYTFFSGAIRNVAGELSTIANESRKNLTRGY